MICPVCKSKRKRRVDVMGGKIQQCLKCRVYYKMGKGGRTIFFH